MTPIWAAASVLAMRRRDAHRMALARRHLARLGVPVRIGDELPARQAVPHG